MATPHPAIIDTNVVVAGLLSRRDDSPVARLLAGMLTGLFPFAISDALLAEYRDVSLRTNIAALHRQTPAQIEKLLAAMVRHAIVLDPVATPLHAPDKDDQHLWELLAAHDRVILVTGDKRLVAARDFPGRILTPEQFLHHIEHD
ncbi:MAG: putative toxin-antitoxin system toxin component, PIN family [Rudaea sp.]|uniref:putative toxin-antitoxin system toxin component, PIN family n=1 Tax=Rudaea sp. TaxID=2136325 RepID=UPI0039E62C05